MGRRAPETVRAWSGQVLLLVVVFGISVPLHLTLYRELWRSDTGA